MPDIPGTLGPAGAELYQSITDVFDLRADEHRILLDACALADMAQAIEDEWISLGRPMLAEGSMKQKIVHPLIAEMRATRGAIATLLKSLRLPDEVEDQESSIVPMSRSDAGRRGAAARHAPNPDLSS
jgi:hypothetical protein